VAASFPWQHARGSSHGRAKLTESQVAEIKIALSGGTSVTSLALRFAVSIAAISNIKQGKNWTHVTVPERRFN